MRPAIGRPDVVGAIATERDVLVLPEERMLRPGQCDRIGAPRDRQTVPTERSGPGPQRPVGAHGDKLFLCGRGAATPDLLRAFFLKRGA